MCNNATERVMKRDSVTSLWVSHGKKQNCESHFLILCGIIDGISHLGATQFLYEAECKI